MAATKGGEKAPLNWVHQNTILCETIRKENRCQKIFTNYGINPFRKIHVIAGKPNSPHDTADGEEDPHFLRIIERAYQEPGKKYSAPQTESQEYGWINTPLIEHDKSDRRLNFHHQNTSVTKYMDIAWRMKEQKETGK
ncbi:hypothetical protein BsWGS_19457 [Bradybaena similaris]